MDEASLFTQKESEAIKSSWNTLTQNGIGVVGQLILHRFFNDVPEVRKLFYDIGVDSDIPQSYSLATLQQNKKFVSHAQRVANALDSVVKNLDNTPLIVKKCTNLGRVHVKRNVKPHHFDLLGEVVVRVITEALDIETTHPTILAWIKAYGAIASTAKSGMSRHMKI